MQQFWCNVIWKFVEGLFTYQKAPFEKFCDLQFSRKSRYHEIVFAEPLHVSCMGWEVKIDISGQSNDCLRVCNVKMKNFLLGQKRGTFLRIFGFWGCSVKWFELIFSKMLKLHKKESLDPKMSDFEWLSEAFNFSMLNMLDLDLSLFAYFWSYYLSNFDVWPLISKLRTCSTRIWSNFATRAIIRYLKMGKSVRKLQFSDTFCHFKVPWRLPSGNFSPDSCRAGPKLQNEYSNIKIRQELTSEIRKMWGNLKFLHDHEISQFFHNQIT